MNNSPLAAEINFRFLRLDKFQAYSLVREILGSTHQKYENNNGYLASVPLTRENFEAINDYYIRQRIDIKACDISVAVNSHFMSGDINVPTIVNRMLKYIDCKLTFSFIIT